MPLAWLDVYTELLRSTGSWFSFFTASPNHFVTHSLTPVHPIDRAQQSVQNTADKLPPSSPDEDARLSSSHFVVVQHRLQILTESETFNCYLLLAASQSTERMSSHSLTPTLPSSRTHTYTPNAFWPTAAQAARHVCQSFSKHSSKSLALLSHLALSLPLSLSA